MADKMTAEEIVKTLRNCASDEGGRCKDCALGTKEWSARCIGILQSQAIDLIENQGKEIESLKAELKQLKFDDEEFMKLARQNDSSVFTPEELLDEIIKANDSNKWLKNENSTLQAKVRELESEKLQREENKALTLEELKLMEGMV